MKKIFATLTVIVAVALGAQGQTTISTTGSSTLSDLTFTPGTTTPIENQYEQARLIFRFQTLPAGVNITLSGLTLTGEGIDSSLSFANVVLDSTSSKSTSYVALDTPLFSFNSASSRLSFTSQVSNGALPYGGQLTYSLIYNDIATQADSTIRSGNLTITAVPEPSTYVAAAGLLALFLWSSRRHLFKLAGARSSASGPGENGAA